MIKVVLLVGLLSCQILAEQFKINWLQNRLNPDRDNNVYELSENQTANSNPPGNHNSSTTFTIDERNENAEKDKSPAPTEQPTNTSTATTNSTTTTTTSATTTSPPTPVRSTDLDNFHQKMRLFAARFYSKLLKVTDANENIVYSPISITHAMGMVNTGARGNSTRQIKESFHYDGATENSYIDSLFRTTTSSKFVDSIESEVTKLMVARSYIQDGFTVKPNFLTAIQTQYHSDVKLTNFSMPQMATDQINQWVKDKTNQLIKELISPGIITVDTRLVLVNAIYFKAPWSSKFATLPPREFTTLTGKVTVPFMSATIYCQYQEAEYSQFIAIPYKDERTYFFIIVPKTNGVLKSFENERFLGKYFKNIDEKIFNQWRSRKIELHMPKFSVEQKIDVKTILKSMGVTDIFDIESADLSGIAKDLHVSDFVHKAKLSIDEKGTEAAAASAAVVSGRTLVKEVHVNRPFLFGIIERKGDILFMGKVVNPSGK